MAEDGKLIALMGSSTPLDYSCALLRRFGEG